MDNSGTRGNLVGDVSFCGFEVVKRYLPEAEWKTSRAVGVKLLTTRPFVGFLEFSIFFYRTQPLLKYK